LPLRLDPEKEPAFVFALELVMLMLPFWQPSDLAPLVTVAVFVSPTIEISVEELLYAPNVVELLPPISPEVISTP
jgi:hypothetical protein